MGWFPEFRDTLPPNPTVQDEMRNVLRYIYYDSLKQTYDEENKVSYGYFKLGRTFPKNEKGLYNMIDHLTDKEAKFLKKHYRYSKDSLDEKKWGA